VGTGVFLFQWVSGPEHEMDHSLYTVPKLKMLGASSPFSIHRHGAVLRGRETLTLFKYLFVYSCRPSFVTVMWISASKLWHWRRQVLWNRYTKIGTVSRRERDW